ncbi:unnamed protein product, partial [Sphacelaria rigidula]
SAVTRKLYTEEESQAVWRFGYTDGRNDWESLAQEAKRKPNIFHESHANASSLKTRFKHMKAMSPSRTHHVDSPKSDASRKRYTTAECSRIWRFGYVEGRTDWENLALEAARTPWVFHETHANPNNLRRRFTKMVHPDCAARFRAKFGAACLKRRTGDKDCPVNKKQRGV